MLLMLITVTILSILLYTLLLQQEGVFNALCCRFVVVYVAFIYNVVITC